MGDAAKVAERLCQCNTYKAHKAVLKAANEKVVSANTKEWTKAAHLKCVLAGTSVGSCTVPPLPKVKATSVAKGVDSTKCEKWWAGAPIPDYCNTGYKAFLSSSGYRGPIGTSGGWTSVMESGGKDTKGKKFKMIRLNQQSGFTSGSKASTDRYVNLCLAQVLKAVGCGNVNGYDASRCPQSIAMPNSWGCNMMGGLRGQFGTNIIGLLTNIGPNSQNLYTPQGQPQTSTYYYPVCGKWE